MKKNFLLASLIIFCFNDLYCQCACSAGASMSLSNGDYNNGAFNLPKRKFSVEGFEDYRTFVKKEEDHHHNMEMMDSTEMAQESHIQRMFISSLGVKFGLTDKITLSAVVPYILLKTDKGDSKSFGDLVLLGTFGLYAKHDLNIALSAGIETTVNKSPPPSLENTTAAVSSGSIDPMMGVSGSKKWNRIILQINTIGKYTTLGYNGTYYGSVNTQNLTVSYLLENKMPKCASDSLKPENKTKLAIFAGYYGEWLGQTEKDRKENPDTGYYLGFATIGSSLAYKGFTIPLTFSFPFVQNINGEQEHSGYRIKLGLIKTF